MSVKVNNEFEKEASLYTLIVIVLLLSALFFLKLHIPDPPINERGGGPNGKGKMMELAFAPVASDNPTQTPSKQEIKVDEQVEEETKEEVSAVVENNTILSDNTSKEEIHVSKEHVENPVAENNVTNSPEATNKVIKKKKKTGSNNPSDFYSEDLDGGGDPSGNSTTGVGGNSTGSGGSEHDLGGNGWDWASPPTKEKKSTKNGEIVFRVEIDENGKVLIVKPKTYTVDYEIMQYYQEECYKLKFVRKNNLTISGVTKGNIKFTFKTN